MLGLKKHRMGSMRSRTRRDAQDAAIHDPSIQVLTSHARHPQVTQNDVVAVISEMLLAARLHFNWCKGHLSALRSPAERYGAKRGREGERLRRVLFRGRRVGALVCCGICTISSDVVS